MRASEAVSKANSERGQIPTLLVPNNIGNDAQDEPEFNVEVRDPKDKAEEELIIISANKQREKTPEQRINKASEGDIRGRRAST